MEKTVPVSLTVAALSSQSRVSFEDAGLRPGWSQLRRRFTQGRAVGLLRWLIAVTLAVALNWAQTPRATLTGTVLDPQDAAVPEAEVEATHVATGISYRVRSSNDGTYVLTNLPIGVYRVSVTAPGFKKFVRDDVRLEVAQRLRLDVRLEVGALTETVTVSGEIPRLSTEEATLGTVVERQRIEELPLNGRHVFSLVRLVAGVRPVNRQLDGFAEVTNQGFSQIQFNGGPIYGNQFFIDGAMNTVPVHNEISVVPLADAVEEFKVETNALKAEYGQTSGGVVNVATKSGTNELHGSLYEFFRNDALDARHAFATQVDPLTGRIKPILRYNQYGGTAGGPIYLPKLYDGRNSSFFFVGYEQWRHRTSSLQRATVPTPEQRVGDFTKTFDAQGRLIPLYDPATTRPNPAGSGWVRDPLPGNVVPRSRMDKVALNILEYMPLPNITPEVPLTNSLNYLSLAASAIDQGATNLRFDHRFSDSDSMFFRYTATRNTRRGRGWGLGPADPDTFARRDQRDNHNWSLSETHVFSPQTLNEFKAAVTRQNLPFLHPSFGQGWPQKLGLPSIVPGDLFPRVEISGFLALGASSFAAGIRAQHTVQLTDSLTLVRGRHTIKVGTDQRWYRLNWRRFGYVSGLYSFSASLTNNPQSPAGTGHGMATFLLGEVSGGSQEFLPAFSFHAWSNGSYIQDDFKLTPRLTLNLGLRYDLASEPVERHNRHSNFDPYVVNPETGWLGVLTYAGITAPRHFVDRDYNNFGPRLGLAYDLTGDGKTAIRAGYSLIYLLVESGDTQGDNSNSLGFSASTTFAPVGGGPFKAFQLSDGPASLIRPLGPKGGPSAFRGQNVFYQDRNAPTPYLQQWNFTLQRALPGRWVVSASYAGNKGTKLFGANYDLNQMDPAHFSLGLKLQDRVANPFYGQIKQGALSGATITLSQWLRPYPDYLNVMTFANHGASSTYHSFQLTIERRFHQGLSALITYTNSKLIDDSLSNAGGNAATIGEFRVGRFNRRLERAIDQNDVTHRFVGSVVWELPFGPGKRWGANARGVVGRLVGGWQVNSIVTIESGVPLMVRGANNFTGINFPDVIRDPTLPRSQRSVNRWFDTDAFRNPAPFTIGNAPRTLPNTRGPGMFDVALSVFKKFRLTESAGLEFRAEAFNALNHVNYNNPNTSFSPNQAGVNTNALFGRITSAMDARRVQLGLRLTF